VALVLEIKGFEDDQDKAKHNAAKRWVSAVNNWGQRLTDSADHTDRCPPTGERGEFAL
jgi:type III restriction enzyme